MTRRIPSYLAEAEPRPTLARVIPPASIPSPILFSPPDLPPAATSPSRDHVRARPNASTLSLISSLCIPFRIELTPRWYHRGYFIIA